jgi:hypothetical protein
LGRKGIPFSQVLSHSLPLLRFEFLPLSMALSKKLLILGRKLFPSFHPAAHFTAFLGGKGFPPLDFSFTIRPPADEKRALFQWTNRSALTNENVTLPFAEGGNKGRRLKITPRKCFGHEIEYKAQCRAGPPCRCLSCPLLHTSSPINLTRSLFHQPR